MKKRIILGLVTLILGGLISFFVITTQKNAESKYQFALGLDLSGGTSLLYEADTSTVPAGEIESSMNALRDVIERRINLYGVSEPVVQVQKSSVSGKTSHRLSVELPGVTDIDQAVALIGQTPFLEFKVQSNEPTPVTIGPDGTATLDASPTFLGTDLTGKYIKRAQLVFDQTSTEPIISLVFTDEGGKLFEQITKENVGKVLAIYLDGQPISAPVIREAITGGEAQISGGFTAEDARLLVGRLNSGALPVQISLLSSQTVGASLGADAINDGVNAALIGFIAIALFLLIWYRLPGLVSVISLAIYTAITLAVYKVLPVTLTAAGIAGFVISIGLAVDATILIMERFKDERRGGKNLGDAMSAGYDRAWLSIRDANTATLITAVILFWFGSTLIKGFALTLGIGVFIGLFSALTVSRLLLLALPRPKGKVGAFLFSSGFTK
jgi:preprotein translocase subunit SecD